MAIRNIVKEGDEILTKVCRPVTVFDARLQTLIEDMKQTLAKSNGVGLAAPQVGVLKRLVLVLDDDDETVLVLINPEIVAAEGTQTPTEGCLSVPGIWGKTVRPAKVTVRALNEKGEEVTYTRTGITAVCFCHELDHLDGHLFRERVTEYVHYDD
ncbi:MAG: peptide deformylase [Clostridia bacterium]|nr:peptide deformylase [Clostridia bacterium]MBQ2272310.1 peptide deformylase [Clostridia bacterium]MBQ5820471.1 peptide deformylase [Clostridia bacterium]